jgi:holo-[acyl-carrier protein] synthase
MIIGIGIDLIEVDRVRHNVEGDRGFRERVFSPDEIAYCERLHDPAQHFAARFAAKEAFFKALGTGWRDGLEFTDVELVNDELGKPELRLSGLCAEAVQKRRGTTVLVSLTHLKETAGAVVIIEGWEGRSTKDGKVV